MGHRILIIDDEPDQVAMLRILLRDRGHRVESATNPLYALSIAKDFHPEIVLIDIRLPYMDGYRVAEKMKRDFAGAKLIAISGHAGEEARQRALAIGFMEYLVKPVSIEEIERLLEEDP